MTEAHFIEQYLSKKLWRLNNLYHIVDKEDNICLLKLNHAQITSFKIAHPKTITLKSRQQGISTYKVAEGLDKCLFQPNTQSGIQSYGQSEAKKLSKKALFMWDNLDQDIKDLLDIQLLTANAEGFTFSNGSTLKIGNFRGDTLSSLHVSELAKIAKKFPEKAEELNTGAFEAVSTNSSISIESTAEGATGLYYEMWKTAERRVKAVGKENLTPLDFYPIFLSWLDDPDCQMEEYYEASEADKEYFQKITEETQRTTTPEQQNWAAAKRDRLGNKFDREYPYSPDSAFNIKVEGTYYGHEYEGLKYEEGLYDSNLPVHSAMDLGMSDYFSIGFFQYYDKKVRIIGEFQDHGHSLEYYADIYKALAKDKGWVHGTTYVPHDITVRELIAGRTRWDEMDSLGFNLVKVDKHNVADGIEATRAFLKDTLYALDADLSIIPGCIQNYRQDYSEKYGIFLDKPLHDGHSHPADMLRYMAMGLRYNPPREAIKPRYNRPRTGFSV